MSRHLVKNFLQTVEKNEHFNILKFKKNNTWNNLNRKELLNNITNCIYVLNDRNIEKGDRIMGMGHAVYKTVDPRSMVLKGLSKKLSEKTGLPWYNITKKVEETTSEIMKNRKERDIFPNVDLYSASVYYMLNIPMDLNTPIFAISRVSGWAAQRSHPVQRLRLQKTSPPLCG